MTIEGITHNRPVPEDFGTGRRGKVKGKDSKSEDGDEVRISDRARKVQEVSRYIGVVKGLPGIREGKVRESREKVERGEYLTREMAEKTAESLIRESNKSREIKQ